MRTELKGDGALGIDLGGTSVKAAVVSEEGALLRTWNIPTEADRGGSHVIRRLLDLCRRMLEELPNGVTRDRIIGIGIGCPGVFNYETGELVAGAVNLPGLSGTPLRALFEKELGLPTRVDNDANVFALAEAKWGAGEGAETALAYTLGTGVGGGVVIGGRVFRGAWGFAGELGHITVEPEGLPCPCGNRGCVEQYASANAIANYARQLVTEGRRSSLSELPPDKITCRAVGEAAEDGDELAQEIVQRAAFYLAVAVGASVITLNPEVVIIGGGGAQLGPRLLDPIQEMLRERVYHHSIREVPVVGAKLGTDSGMIGAGALAFLEKPQVVSQSRSIATRRGERNKRAV